MSNVVRFPLGKSYFAETNEINDEEIIEEESASAYIFPNKERLNDQISRKLKGLYRLSLEKISFDTLKEEIPGVSIMESSFIHEGEAHVVSVKFFFRGSSAEPDIIVSPVEGIIEVKGNDMDEMKIPLPDHFSSALTSWADSHIKITLIDQLW